MAIVPLIPAFAAILTGEPIAYLSFVLVFLLYFVLVFPVRYRLGPEALEIRGGVMRWRVPYPQMRSVRRTRSALAAPALSFDRLEILYGAAGRALVSPSDQREFLADLYGRAPHLQVRSVPDLGMR